VAYRCREGLAQARSSDLPIYKSEKASRQPHRRRPITDVASGRHLYRSSPVKCARKATRRCRGLEQRKRVVVGRVVCRVIAKVADVALCAHLATRYRPVERSAGSHLRRAADTVSRPQSSVCGTRFQPSCLSATWI
jgi:hypothetical protein